MNVQLIEYTQSADKLVYLAYRTCRNKEILEEMHEILAQKKPVDYTLIEKGIKLGHESPLEHVVYTFLITDISRVTSHQLVRHRIASYSQYSHRKMDAQLRFVLPDEVNQKEVQELFKKMYDLSVVLYDQLINSYQVPAEVARYIIPSGVTTNIMCTFNARSLRNFFRLRLAKEASSEIRELARRMYDLVVAVHPWFFFDIEPGN